MKMKTVLIASAGIGAGMVIANYLTDGAVFEAASTMFGNMKDRVMHTAQDTTEAVADVAESVADVTESI